MLTAQNDKLEKGLAQPLLASTEHDPDDDGSEEAVEESRGTANSLGEAYRLLTPSVKVINLVLMNSHLFNKSGRYHSCIVGNLACNAFHFCF